MYAQARRIAHTRLVMHDASGLQVPEKLRHGSPARAVAVVLVSRHPLVISSPPTARGFSLDTWGSLLTLCRNRLGFPLSSSAGGFKICHAPGTIVILVAEVQDTRTVPAAVVTLTRRAYGSTRKPAPAFPEGYDPGVDVLAGLYKATLDPAFPVWLVVGDGGPKFYVILDAHNEGCFASRG